MATDSYIYSLDKTQRRVREFLVKLCNDLPNKVICYEDLCSECKLGYSFFYGLNEKNKQLFSLLETISRFEHERGRPLLSAVVVLADKKIQGKGFFDLSNELGIREQEVSINPLLNDDKEFAKAMIEKCHLYWQNGKNYLENRIIKKTDKTEYAKL